MNKQVYEFIITLLKCFFILLFFGFLLPEFLNYFICNFINKNHNYDNSILVHNLVHKNINIIINYINIFKDFLQLW